MPFQKGQRVRQRNSAPSDIGIITGTYSINIPEMQYDVHWDADGSTSEHVPEIELDAVSIAPIYMVGQRVETRVGEGVIRQIGETFPVRYGVYFDDKMGVFWFFANELSPSAPEPKMRFYIYVAPYSLMLTPNDTDMTELLQADVALVQLWKEHKQTFSVEVMGAVGKIITETKKIVDFTEES